ncbi:MAG TPA: TetR/AcrR family transcriptional regulator [Steroidobacteraceae bacterium]|nr:TetR/AcrR family transcriptional regulator [Steroidobacteraceae bacterium]
MGRKGDERRHQILSMAKQMLLDGGSNSFVLRDVAERLHITHGNLQYYFPTKQDLFVAIFDEELAKYTDAMKTAVASTTTKRGRLAAIIDSGFQVLRSPETSLWRTMMSMADHSKEMAAILKKENDLYEAAVTKELKQIAPELSPQRRRHIAKIVHAIIDGLGIQFGLEDPNSPDMRALESEIRALIVNLIETD